MLVALLLVGVAAYLFWSYIQQKLQRKQQVAVVGGLKDMDDTTLKKVLGEVGIIFSPNMLQLTACTITCSYVHRWRKAMHVVLVQVDLPSWVNFPDYERVSWLNSIIGKVLLFFCLFFFYLKVLSLTSLPGSKHCLYATTPTKHFFV